MSQLAAVLVYRVCDGRNVNRRAKSYSRFGGALTGWPLRLGYAPKSTIHEIEKDKKRMRQYGCAVVTV